MGALALPVAAVVMVLLAGPANADNCGTPSDCFGTAGSFTRTAWGLVVLSGLSLVLDLLPGVGIVKGVAEGAIGRDLLTGQELSPAERALGAVPYIGALGDLTRAAGKVRAAARALDDVGDVARTADNAGAAGRRLTGVGAPGRAAVAGGPPVRGGPPRGGDGGPAGPDDVLVRRGSSWESASRLRRQAEAAEQQGFPHGVSVTTPASNARLSRDPADAAEATRRAFEDAGFPIHHTPTRSDPNHHTVELPKPVTDDVARRFNEILGRTRRP